eukprot:Clim_evm31s253 gene=Clim_evmTU31s253
MLSTLYWLLLVLLDCLQLYTRAAFAVLARRFYVYSAPSGHVTHLSRPPLAFICRDRNYMTQVIQNKNSNKGLLVTRVVHGDLEDNRGLVSAINQLKLETHTGDTINVIVKSHSEGLESSYRALTIGQWREAHFLRHLMDHKQDETSHNIVEATQETSLRALVSPFKLYTPRIFFAGAQSFTGDYVIISELVEPRVGMNLCLGNQIWGLPDGFRNPFSLGNRGACVAMGALCGKMHRPFLNDPRLAEDRPELRFLRAHQWYLGANRLRWESAAFAIRRAWLRCKHQMGTDGVQWNSELTLLLDAVMRDSSWEALQRLINHRDRDASDRSFDFVLSHGDFHGSNCILRYDSGHAKPISQPGQARLIMADWSEIGLAHPSYDLAQFLISDVTPQLRRQVLDDVAQAYANELQSELWTADTVKEQLAERGVERWLALIPFLMSFTNIPVELRQYFHDQVHSFCSDLGVYSGRYGPYLLTSIPSLPPFLTSL